MALPRAVAVGRQEHPALSRDRALVPSDQATVLIVEADRAAWEASAGGGYTFPYLNALSYLNVLSCVFCNKSFRV